MTTEKSMSAFSPVMAVYSGKKDGKKEQGTIMIIGLSQGHEVQAMVLDDQGCAVRLGVMMLRKGLTDWKIELNPFAVNLYLKQLERETEETMLPLLETATLADEEVGSWDDEA